MDSSLPIIDVSELVAGDRGRSGRWAGAAQLREACEESGFFYVVGHGVAESLQARLRDGVEAFVYDQDERWDHASVHDFQGTYGDYLLDKVGKVFPELRQARTASAPSQGA